MSLVALLLAGALPVVEVPDGGHLATTAWCAGCHAAQADDFASSRHAAGSRNVLYRANHRLEPMQWCDGCHEPFGMAEPGIGCAACHVRDGAVLTAGTVTDAGLAAHGMRTWEGLADERACQGCHQFNFPSRTGEPVVAGAAAMQDTVAEWRAAGAAERCTGCHGAHHARGGHDVTMVRSTLHVTVEARGAGELGFTLANDGAPHHVPTGDPFRTLVIELCRDEDCDVVVSRVELGRTIARAGTSWRVTRDWTVPAAGLAGPGVRTVELARPRGATAYRVLLRYVPDSTARLVPAGVASGELFHGLLP